MLNLPLPAVLADDSGFGLPNFLGLWVGAPDEVLLRPISLLDCCSTQDHRDNLLGLLTTPAWANGGKVRQDHENTCHSPPKADQTGCCCALTLQTLLHQY